MARTLVTGAAGFLGLHVVERLRAHGVPLRLVARNEAGIDRLKASGSSRGEEVLSVDLTQRFAVPGLLEGCDQVIHVAGKVSSRRSDRRALYQDNVVAAAHVLDAALAAKVRRLVYVSHVSGVGAPEDSTPADERVEFRLEDLPGDYVQAKRVAELEALRTWTRGLPIVFATPTFCVGPGDVHGSSRFVLEPLRLGLPFAPPGGVNLVDVRDAAKGIVAALEHGIPGQRYLLGGVDLSFRDVIGRISAVTGGARPRFAVPTSLARAAGEIGELLGGRIPLDRARTALYGRFWYYDHGLATRALGYRPGPIDDALQASIVDLAARRPSPAPVAQPGTG